MHEPEAPGPFNYTLLDEETREYVLRKTHETHGLLKRTAESIILIGENLLLVQEHLPESHFSAWLRAEFDLSRRSAYNYMRVARKFGGSYRTVLQLPARVLYELASSSEAILTQVEEGQIPATVQAIKAAREAERQAKEAESQALSEMQAARQHLSSAQEEIQMKQVLIDRLTVTLAQVREEIAVTTVLSAPSVEIQEVEKEVVPPEIVQQLEALQQKVTLLTQQRDTLAQQVADLQEEARTETSAQREEKHEQLVRLNWYRITGEFQKSARVLLAQWPSSLDVAAFESDDWNRLADVKEMIRRLLDACDRLTRRTNGQIVEGWVSSDAVIADSQEAETARPYRK